MRSLVAGLPAGAVVALTAVGSLPAALAAQSAVPSGASAGGAQVTVPGGLGGLLARARAALAGEVRAHLHGQLSEVQDGVGVYVAVDLNAAASGGTLSETIASNGRELRLGAVLTATRGYCTGSPDALTAGCALSAAQAWAAVGHWVSFGPRTVAYRTVRASVVLGDQVAGLLPPGAGAGFRLTATRAYAGQHVVELKGPAPAAADMPAGTTETLDLAARGRPLPVAARFVDAGRVSSTEWFSAWGKSFSVRPPAHSVPASSLG